MAEQFFESESRPWEGLKRAFLARLLDATSLASAKELWRLFADDPWFRDLLDRRARRTLAVRHLRLAWLGDLKHEALLALARRLAKTPDMRVDLERVDETFPAWIGVIVERACGDAIHWLTELDRLHRVMLEDVAAPPERQSLDAVIDMELAIGEQPEPERTMLHLKSMGCSVPEIAERLEMTYWEAYRRLHAAAARLERRLADYRYEPSGRNPLATPSSSSSTMTR